MNRSATLSIAIAAILVLAVVLNPSAEKHREKIKQVISERSQVERLLGIGHLTSFVSRYHSVGVASYTTVDDKITSTGLLGMVFVLD